MTAGHADSKKPTRSRILFWVIVLTLLLLAPSIWLLGEEAGPALHGRWILEFHNDGWLELTLERTDRGRGHHWNSSDDFQTKDFQGLQRPTGTDRVPAHFELRRDAGTLDLDGELDTTGGAGRFAFAPNPEYIETLEGMGYARPDTEEVFSLAVHDVSRVYIRELAELGYRRVSLDDFVAMKIHGATPDFIRELSALGYEGLSTDDLVAMRIHGATPDFIRQMKTLGYGQLPADEIVVMRIHDVTPEFVKAMRELGYARLPADDLVAMRIHGVTPGYVKGFQDLGYGGIPADDLVSMRIHGVTLDYAKRVKERFRDASPEDLVSMRIHGER